MTPTLKHRVQDIEKPFSSQQGAICTKRNMMDVVHDLYLIEI